MLLLALELDIFPSDRGSVRTCLTPCLGLGGIGGPYIFAAVTFLKMRNCLLVDEPGLFYVHGLTSLY